MIIFHLKELLFSISGTVTFLSLPHGVFVCFSHLVMNFSSATWWDISCVCLISHSKQSFCGCMRYFLLCDYYTDFWTQDLKCSHLWSSRAAQYAPLNTFHIYSYKFALHTDSTAEAVMFIAILSHLLPLIKVDHICSAQLRGSVTANIMSPVAIKLCNWM